MKNDLPWFENNKRLHDAVVIALARQLKNNCRHDVIANPKFKRQGSGTLILDKPYYADIIDETAKIVYEVHWKGERKEESFYDLPPPWKGVNVFIEDYDNPFTIIAKAPGYEFAFVERSSFSKGIDGKICNYVGT